MKPATCNLFKLNPSRREEFSSFMQTKHLIFECSNKNSEVPIFWKSMISINAHSMNILYVEIISLDRLTIRTKRKLFRSFDLEAPISRSYNGSRWLRCEVFHSSLMSAAKAGNPVVYNVFAVQSSMGFNKLTQTNHLVSSMKIDVRYINSITFRVLMSGMLRFSYRVTCRKKIRKEMVHLKVIIPSTACRERMKAFSTPEASNSPITKPFELIPSAPNVNWSLGYTNRPRQQAKVLIFAKNAIIFLKQKNSFNSS